MSKVASALVVSAAEKLLAYIQYSTIPYVANGMSLDGMDCQGLCEYLLIQAGVPKAECGLAGSNAHWRACAWTGSPSECIAKYGKIPDGAWLFIWEETGAPSKYDGDGRGNASHMGVVWGKYKSLAASASRGKVIESNFAGKEINGGWNRIGLAPWVDYEVGVDMSTPTVAETPEETTTLPLVSEMQGYIKTHMVIKNGSLGGAVRCLQGVLKSLDFDLKEDGEFGSKTENAVRYYQRTHFLAEDGIVGPATWSALAESYSKVGETAKG